MSHPGPRHEQHLSDPAAPKHELEAHLNELERDIRQFLENEARLKRNYNDLKEFQCVLQKHIGHTAKTELENDGEEINDVGKLVSKSVFIIFFIIFFNGSKLQDIVNRVCEGFFRSYADFFSTAIPQLIFLSCIFIYLCVQILVKWVLYWVQTDTVFGYSYPGSHCAPSLLINMFMFRERKEGFMRPCMNRTHIHCHLAQWYPHQQMVERILVSIAIVCVPIMLFGKPLCRMVFKGAGHNRKRSGASNKAHNISVRVRLDTEEAELIAQEDADNGAVKLRLDDDSGKKKAARVHVGSQSSQHENMSFGDVMVHQSIHTIEFMLGCISHTASHLRLWALTCTRTVKFQSKFYEGAGYLFVPFSLRNSLQKLCAGSDFY